MPIFCFKNSNLIPIFSLFYREARFFLGTDYHIDREHYDAYRRNRADDRCEVYFSLGERAEIIYDINPEHYIVYIFENGKGIKVEMSAYESKTRRRKITGAFSSASPLAGAIYVPGKAAVKIFVKSDGDRGFVFSSDALEPKKSRTGAGVQVMQLPKKKGKVEFATDRIKDFGEDSLSFKKKIPSTGEALSQYKIKF